MNKYTFTIIGLFSLITIAGCASKSTNLIYASRNSVGITFDSAGVDTPGVSLDIGVSNNNLAIVPVAVIYDEYQYSDRNGDSPEANYFEAQRVELISGMSCLGLGSGDQINCREMSPSQRHDPDPKKKLESERNSDIDDYERANQAVQSGFQIRRDQILPDQEITVRPNTRVIESPIDPDYLIVLESTKDGALDLLETNISIGDQTLEERFHQNPVERKNTRDRIGKNLQLLSSGSSTQIRLDAFSVFGSFRASWLQEGSGTQFDIGDTFATGVAAQTLSKGTSDALTTINYNSPVYCMGVAQNLGLDAKQIASVCTPPKTSK